MPSPTTSPITNGLNNHFPPGITTTSNSKCNGSNYQQTDHINYNNLTVPTTPTPNPNALELAFTQPIQVKKQPFAFRILDQLNSLFGRKNEHFDLTYNTAVDTTVDPMRFQQSVTRNLAFPSTSSFASVKNEKKSKHLVDFYNNSSWSLIAKIFSCCVILCALSMILKELWARQ